MQNKQNNRMNGHTVIDAAKIGDAQELRKLLAAGATPDAKDNDNKTALMYAAEKGYNEAVKALIEYGADVNAITKKNELYSGDEYFPTDPIKYGRNSALVLAAAQGHSAVVQTLLEHGAYSIDEALQLAGQRGRFETVLILRKAMDLRTQQERDVDTRDNDGRTSLMWAAIKGHSETVLALLDKGADVNAKDNKGGTALMDAAYSGHKDIVLELLDKGADVNAKDNKGTTALMDAAYYSTRISRFREIDAAYSDQKDIFQLLLDKGADVNARNEDGDTALMRAAYSGHNDIFQLLLDKNADVNARDGKGTTALMRAADWGNKEIVQALLDRGADINAKDNTGHTPLMYASGSDNLVDYSSFDDNGLMKEEKLLPVVRLLLDRGADVNAKDEGNATAQSIAVKWHFRKIARLLLDNGADIDTPDE